MKPPRIQIGIVAVVLTVLASLVVNPFAVQAASLTDGLYGYWPLNEGSGTVVNDASTNHPPGQIRQLAPGPIVGLATNGGVWVNDPVRGMVLGINGSAQGAAGNNGSTFTNAYVFLGDEIIPQMTLESEFTWAFWSKSDRGNGNSFVFGNRYPTTSEDGVTVTEFVPREFIKFTQNQFELQVNGAGLNLNYADIGVQTAWMHHMIVKQGTNLTYYRDGVSNLFRTITGVPVRPLPLYIGGQAILNESWRGYIDEPMIFQRALSPGEAAALVALTFTNSLSNAVNPAPARLGGKSPASGATGVAFNATISATIVEGSTKLNDSTVQFTVNGQVVPHTISPRTQLSPEVGTVSLTTVAPVSPNFYPPLSQVSVVLKYSDTAGAAKEETWSFTAQNYLSVPPSWAASDVDTSKPGFLVRTHQLDDRRHVLGDRGGRIPPAESQLAGRIGPNLADTTSFTSNGYFVETGYINYNQNATSRNDPASNLGNFGATSSPVKNEHPLPGIPGTAAAPTDHAVAEVLAYVDLPAGIVTMGVSSDDGFRLTISPVGALRDKVGVMIAEFDGTRGAANNEAIFVVQQAGRYAMRLLWYEAINDANLEWYTVSGGVRALVNDAADPSAIKAYFARTGPEPTHISVIDPFPFGSTLRLAFPDAPLHIEVTDGGTAVQMNSIVLRINGQAVTPTALAQAGGKTTIEYLPPGGAWLSGANVAVDLIYTHNPTVTNSWTMPVMTYATLADCLRTDLGTGQNPGMRWRTHQLDQTATRANTVAAAEAQLTNPANTADLATATGGFFNIDYVNFEQAGIPDGMFGDNSPAPRNAPELPVPGIPGTGTVGNNLDNITGEATTFIEFPRAGMYYMGVNRDDGIQLSVATTEGGRSLVTGPNVQVLGPALTTGGIDDNNVQVFIPVNVPQPGVWPLRLLWFEGNGGTAVEWYQTDKRGGIGLINDPSIITTLRAFRTRSAQPAATNAAACSPVPVPPTLSVASTTTGITLTFQGTLQQADEAAGPYTDVAGATSPFPTTTSLARKFYRARQ